MDRGRHKIQRRQHLLKAGLITDKGKEPDIVHEITYWWPTGNSDHVTTDFKVKERDQQKDDKHRRGRFNYGRADFENFKMFLEAADWSSLLKQEM